MKHIWIIEYGQYGGVTSSTIIMCFTGTKKQAQAWCRQEGYKGSDELFCKGYHEFLEIRYVEEAWKRHD